MSFIVSYSLFFTSRHCTSLLNFDSFHPIQPIVELEMQKREIFITMTKINATFFQNSFKALHYISQISFHVVPSTIYTHDRHHLSICIIKI